VDEQCRHLGSVPATIIQHNQKERNVVSPCDPIHGFHLREEICAVADAIAVSSAVHFNELGSLHSADERISFGHFDTQRCTAAPAEAASAAAVERAGLVC
jgi:hypothetical protein